MFAAGSTRRIAVYLAFLVLLVAVPVGSACAGEPDQRIVSMVQLLSRPAEFEGKVVLVKGYLKAGFGMRLYLTKEHANMADSASSIPVETPGPELMKCVDSYVAVSGVFGLRDEYGIVKTLEVVRWSDGSVPAAACWTRDEEG